MVMFFSEKKIKVAHKKLTLASLFLPGQIPNEGKFHSHNFQKPLAPVWGYHKSLFLILDRLQISLIFSRLLNHWIE
jgi:hypothetical protein